MEKPKITKEMTIKEVVQKYPQVVTVFIDYGLHCVGCPLAQGESIEDAVKLHQIDIEKLLEDLNEVANKMPPRKKYSHIT